MWVKNNISPTEKKIRNFTDLNAWKAGHTFVKDIYTTTKNFPDDERFGLTNQIRRATVSITSNIAEGFGRSSYREKIQFYSISLGSLTEVQNHLLIARNIGYLSKNEVIPLLNQSVLVSKLTNGLIKGSKAFLRDS